MTPARRAGAFLGGMIMFAGGVGALYALILFLFAITS